MIKCVFWLCTLYRIVFAGENRFLVHEEPKSWISETDYRTMLKESFPFARCCNVIINDTFHELEQSLNDFLREYSYPYIILQSTYDCQGYLLISSTEENLLWALSKVPSTISTTEILIIYDSDLLANSRLFNGSIYNNANVNLVTVSGIWSLSENFLQPRNFEEIERYTDLRFKNGLSNFKGRELQIASYYNPPMMYLKRTVKKTVNGIQAEIFLTDNDSERDGIELRMFMLIAERLNFTWSIRSPPGQYKVGRLTDNNTWEGGMISQLLAKEVDLAFGGIWLKADHNMLTNLTGPWGLLEIKFLVPRPKPFTSFLALTKPFTPLVWTSVILTLLWQTCYMTIRARVKPQESTKRFRRFSYTCMELVGRLIGVWMPRRISGVKIQLQFWQIAGLVLVTAYCSSLAATLTGTEYEERIDTVKQFVEAGLTWGREGPLPTFNEYVNLNNYRLMMNPTAGYYLCFAMQPWLVDKVNMMMLRAIETGFKSFYLKDVIHRRASSSLREVLVEHDKNNGTTIPLALTPMTSGFVMLTVGLTVASVVFLFELFSKNKPDKSSDLMYPKNRESDVATCEGKKDFRQALKELNITKLIKPGNTKHRRNQCSRVQ
ncbi:uncharacterized protein LOC124298149 isoform X2 [Neodiprion virginianus]|uniref:uncharacterized protein LOC124298149 isoform X2 n=1 Tax=Neodiprion virginianus TaxID=2961670 RepID=UPI001EE75228|nr:uncharacterized protein LOC124298149 isoform X2 [Neodiprion virginianus]